MTYAQTERLIAALETIAANLRPQMATQLPVYRPAQAVPTWTPGLPQPTWGVSTIKV